MMMNEATSFMSDTLNDVLSIQKIEEGKLELQYEVFAVKSMINTVHLSLKGQLTSKNLNLIYFIDDNIPLKLRGDRFRIEHILANLISNAIKFSPSNSKITIKVKLQPGKDFPQENILIYFSVIDQGEGITVDTQKKLFIPYSQIKPRELQQGGGTGIGLAICKEIISLHGGEIGVRSKHKSEDPVNHGSEFFFTILFEKFTEDNTLKSPIKSDDKAIRLESNFNTSFDKSIVQDKDLKTEVSGLNKSSWKFLIVDGIVLSTSTLFILFVILIPTYI
jgi:signal transduction histidine kinase